MCHNQCCFDLPVYLLKVKDGEKMIATDNILANCQEMLLQCVFDKKMSYKYYLHQHLVKPKCVGM